jgi:hypothetical protein
MECRKEADAYPCVENFQSPQEKDDPDGENHEADDNDGSVILHDGGCFDSWFVLEMRWGIEAFFSCGWSVDKKQDPSLWLYFSFAVNAIRGLVHLHVTEGVKHVIVRRWIL